MNEFNRNLLDAKDDDDSVAAIESTSSSFSLQDCINEFRARRIRRTSNQSCIDACQAQKSADVDFVHQNQSNKEQERSRRKCKDGFCYCFSSDSGGGDALFLNRAANLRQLKRARRTDQPKLPPKELLAENKRNQRKSVPANLPKNEVFKTERKKFTAINKLVTTNGNAPLIQIIQELRDNLLISEVRVNDRLVNSSRQQKGLNTSSEPISKEDKFECAIENKGDFTPSAPTLTKIENTESSESPENDKEKVTSRRSRSSLSGKLLQKRLSNTNLSFKEPSPKNPPPKPPRSNHFSEAKATTDSVSSSIREAERVVDAFLLKKGVKLPTAANTDQPKESHTNDCTRNGHLIDDYTSNKYQPSPTCPSLSDIECSKKKSPSKTVKALRLGWQEPKIKDMLNYDAAPHNHNAANRFHKLTTTKSRAEPQSPGFQIPPKLSIDTVDCVRQNLATNIEKKETPVKTQLFCKHAKSRGALFSLWNVKHKSGDKNNQTGRSSKKFLTNSKNKFLRFVSPKKLNNCQPAEEQSARARAPFLRTVAVQTSPTDLHESSQMHLPIQSPPGSYHSPIQSCATTSTPTWRQNTEHVNDPNKSYFDFSRLVKEPKLNIKKLEFPLCNQAKSCLAKQFNCTNDIDSYEDGVDWFRGAKDSKTYHSYQQELEHDQTFSRMGNLLSNIRARLEASDNIATKIFEEVDENNRDNDEPQGIDCVDGLITSENTSSNQDLDFRQRNDSGIEPIYSEIEDLVENTKSCAKLNVSKQTKPSLTAEELNLLYAKVNKPPKQAAAALPPAKAIKPYSLGQVLQDSLRHVGCKTPLGTVLEHPTSESQIYNSLSPKYQSLNNIYEQHSPPKRMSNISKSDISLNRSEIFLENLRHSENYVNSQPKMNNHKEQQTSIREPANIEQENDLIEDDNISYDIPEPIYEALDAVRMSKAQLDTNISVQETIGNSMTAKVELHVHNCTSN